jgi:hypothetical protein
MLRRTVHANDRDYLFAPDDSPPVGGRLQSIVKLRVVDELTRRAPESKVVIQPIENALVSRVASEGICGIVGIPQQVFPHLRTNGYVINFTVSADGYVPVKRNVTFAAQANFPDGFVPQTLPDIALHRQPTVIFGRTVRVNGNNTEPVAGAAVSLKSIRRRPPDPNVLDSPDPPNLIALRPPLLSGRPSLTTFIQQRDVIPAVSPDKHLVDDLVPGTNTVLLSDRVGLSVGEVLLIDAAEPDRAEFVTIKTLPVAAPPDDPTLITLDYELAYPHERDAVVRQETPQPAGLPQHFTIDAIEGDTCIFLDGVTALAAANQVQITQAGVADEYHELMRFSVVSDADGYYRLPPLTRAAQVEIHAEKIIGPQTFERTVTFSPDYRQPENRLELLLKV